MILASLVREGNSARTRDRDDALREQKGRAILVSGGKTILVVDDDRSVVAIIEHVLGKAGYSVECAYSAKDAITCIQAKTPDLIILDIGLPDIDGLEVLKRLKAAAETASIPVALLTGKREYQDVLQGYQLGSDYYISKPFTRTQLRTAVSLLLGSDARESNTSLL